MKYLKQFFIILSISFIGEICKWLIPLPIAGSIYGIVILFVCLQTKILKVSDVKETSTFLIDIMAIMFIPAAVGLIDIFEQVSSVWFALTFISIITVFIVMIVSGHMTQLVMKSQKKGEKHD